MAAPGGKVPGLSTWVTAGAFLAGILLSLFLEDLAPPLPEGHTRSRGNAASSASPSRPPGPGRVVVLSPALVEIVFDIGAGSQVAGVPDFLFGPPRALALPRVGGSFNPAFEKILELRPRFLLFQGRSAKVRSFAARHSIPCPDPPLELDTLADLFQAYWRVGRIMGVPVEAEDAAHRLRSGLARLLEETLRAGPGPRVFLALGHRKGTLAGVYTATGKTFLGQIVRLAGGRNLFEEAPGKWPQVSIESLQAGEPEVVLDFHPGEKADPAALLSDWRRTLPGIPAVRNGKVRVLTEDFLLLPGPRVVRTARILAGIFRPSRRAGGEAPEEGRKR